MKFSPKLVTIFSDEFSVEFSPILVIFFGKWKNRRVVKHWNFHQNWWQYFLMNFLFHFRLFKGIKNDISMCQTHKYKNTDTKYTNTAYDEVFVPLIIIMLNIVWMLWLLLLRLPNSRLNTCGLDAPVDKGRRPQLPAKGGGGGDIIYRGPTVKYTQSICSSCTLRT